MSRLLDCTLLGSNLEWTGRVHRLVITSDDWPPPPLLDFYSFTYFGFKKEHIL